MWNLGVRRLPPTHSTCSGGGPACILQWLTIPTMKNCDGHNSIYKAGALFGFVIRQLNSSKTQNSDGRETLHFIGLVYIWMNSLYWRVGAEKLLNLGMCFWALSSIGKENLLTVTFHPLMDKSVQQWPAVITEGGASVSVDFKFVLAPGVLGEKKHITHSTHRKATFLNRVKLRPRHAPLPCPRSIDPDCAPCSGVMQWMVATLPHHILSGCPDYGPRNA